MSSGNSKIIRKIYQKKYLEDMDQNSYSFYSEQRLNLKNTDRVLFKFNTISSKNRNSNKFPPELIINKINTDYSPKKIDNTKFPNIFNLKQIIKELDKCYRFKKEIKKLRKANENLEKINKELKEKLIDSKKLIKEQTKFCDELSNCLSDASRTIMEYKGQINEIKKISKDKKFINLKENYDNNKIVENVCVNDYVMVIKRNNEEIKELKLQKEKIESINKNYKQDLIEMKDNIQIIQNENYRLTKKLNEIVDMIKEDKYNFPQDFLKKCFNKKIFE